MGHVERLIAKEASKDLGREVTEDFVDAVIHGDPFVYERKRQEDMRACGAVLRIARAREGRARERESRR